MSQAAVATTKGRLAHLAQFAGRTLKTSLAIVGVASIGAVYYEYKTLSPVLQDRTQLLVKKQEEDGKTKEQLDKKKKVLVIPFNRLRIVEQKKSNFSSSLESFDREPNEDKTREIEIRELVDLIHSAASDPEIGALYGVFGHGSALMSSGWADLEEVRNALRVFRESHRLHAEPNFGHDSAVLVQRVDRKPMYAYSDTFASFGDPGNKDYYLASIFTHIHMQKTGELNLFGATSEQIFLRGLLEKYGVNVHVFKHGKYKNFPNRLTEFGLNRAHRENVSNIVEQLNQDVCDDIQQSRSKALLTGWLRKDGVDIWTRIQNAGTFPAQTAWKSGLIDYIPRRSPLFDLMEANLEKSNKEDFKAEWKHEETDFDRFPAADHVDLKDYAKTLVKKKKAQARLQSWRDLAEKRPEIGKALSMMGVKLKGRDGKPREKIALIHVEGGIADGTACNVVNTLRKLKKDKTTKCLVVRVSSPGGTIQACETISQELKALKIPVVFSFGNVSASGGYYIASGADRIFASNKTVTGSIGVFGIRPDFTDFIGRYGIHCDHVSIGEYSALLSPFHPMTRKMKDNFAQSIDRYYKQFKGVVSDGRGLSMDTVEEIGQGRVWTGGQAQTNGLVDEIGGLYRALAYAKRVHTGGDADVVVWPKKETIVEKIVAASETRSPLVEIATVLRHWAFGEKPERCHWEDSSTADLLAQRLVRMVQDPSAAGKLAGGVMMAADENTAINLLLQDSGLEKPGASNDFGR